MERCRALVSSGLVFAWSAVVCLLAAPVAWSQSELTMGLWSPVMHWPLSATHASLLPDGTVMFFGEFEEGLLPPRRWNPDTGELTALPHPGYNIFCAGHSFLADGRLLVTGGHVESHVGLADASLFDAVTSTWTRLPEMNAGRWYPTNTTLSNGDVLVLSGEVNGSGDINPVPQRYLAQSQTWKTYESATKDLPYYPRMFLAPDGKLFFATPWRGTLWFDPEGEGTWTKGPSSNFGGRSYGPAVYLDGKVLIIGGGDPPTDTVEEIDLNAATPRWRHVAPMTTRRRQHNATLLPDGTVLVTGGSSSGGFDTAAGSVAHAELWSPTTNTWRRLADSAGYRGYHSIALLLPDGRVLTAGGRHDHTAEVFAPPYLFKGPRPELTDAPATVSPGATFDVVTPDAARIARVTLIALGSVTHAFDQNQRLLTLDFTRGDGTLTLRAPPTHHHAPPGDYHLFLVDTSGVPSIGRRVRVLPP
ncbi:DUF1929 domain-containing protein [Myxococcus sp. K15C18031901]|uniref:galactose oxidase-like domain-containing protein n=1 Tax=Myxococcus dinghuensis TaxID=2906761 RepID=UPI0020A77E03|nr:galactose oxidase-like domain-containing protein [Myxococcus dinghuensis]MCP3102073.1 DUF1929 domain-containing protein [Myxococcus dinghuensis]